MTNDLKAQLAATQAEWDAKRTNIQHLRGIDRVQNEGGEGYSSYEAAAERLADEYLPRITALQNAIFAAEWTYDVTVARRAAWNAEVVKLGTKVNGHAIKSLVARLGYSQTDIVRAKALHGIK